MCEIKVHLTSALWAHRPSFHLVFGGSFKVSPVKSPLSYVFCPGPSSPAVPGVTSFPFSLGVLLKGLLGDVCSGLSEAVTDPTPLSLSAEMRRELMRCRAVRAFLVSFVIIMATPSL